MRLAQLIDLELSEVRKGDDLVKLVLDVVTRSVEGLRDLDVVATASNVVSKAKGYLVSLDRVKPGPEAERIAPALGTDLR